jgi:predicted Fe-Mo cluster-binding NifX family protein
MDPASQSRHARMVANINDCEVLLARGMGMGAYNNLNERGITPLLTDIADIDDAVSAYLNGELAHNPSRMH